MWRKCHGKQKKTGLKVKDSFIKEEKQTRNVVVSIVFTLYRRCGIMK